MLAKTHILFGAGLALAASQAAHLSVPATLMIVGSGAIGGLLPDIDHPGSTFGRRIWPVSLVISKVFGHRGITHSLLAVAGLTILLLSGHRLSVVSLGLIVGYLSHLLGDFITPHGIPLFWPLKRCYRIPRPIRTGGLGESVLGFLVVFTGAAWVWNRFA